MFIKIKYANIINIISNEEIIPEYIQSNFTAANISNALNHFLTNPNQAFEQVKRAKSILKTIRFKRCSTPTKKAALIILKLATQK